MPKLHLKRSPEEKATAKSHKPKRKVSNTKREGDLPYKRPRRNEDTSRNWASSDEELRHHQEPGPSSVPHPRQGSVKLSPDHLQAELEERRFREKMFDALEDNERLDSLEAQLNDYAHVPERWRSGRRSKPGNSEYSHVDEFLQMDPHNMDDEEYAEWIRVGMYRRMHAEEHAEQQHQKALKAERHRVEKARKLETQRLERLAEQERKRKGIEREHRKRQRAVEEYETRWKQLLSGQADQDMSTRELSFYDIPWPVLLAHHLNYDEGDSHIPIFLKLLTREAIVDFLFPTTFSTSTASITTPETVKKERKVKLRETILRFHPDKFEGRLMQFVKEAEKDVVRAAVSQVVQCLNALMVENT